MNLRTLTRRLSTVAMFAGALRAASSFVPGLWGTAGTELAYTITDLSLLLGWLGIYLAQQDRLGALGFWAFVLGVLGLGIIAGPEGSYGTISAYMVGSPVVGLAFVLLAVAQWHAGTQRPVPGMVVAAMLLAMALGGVGMALPQVPAWFQASGLLLGAAFAANGWHSRKLVQT